MLRMLSIALLCGTIANAEEAKSTSFTLEQEKEINKIVWQTIEANPEKMINIFQKFGEEQQEKALKKVQEKINSLKDQLGDPKNAIVIGNENSAVKFVLFVDPNCKHCRIFETTLNEIEKTLPEKGKMAILVRQWPILGPDSEEVAAALIAAYQQDAKKFKALSDKLLARDEGKGVDQKQFMELAKDFGFDIAKLEAAAMSDAIKSQIENTKMLAKDMGLEATPTSILVDKQGARLLQIGSKDELKKILTDALKAS